MNKVMGWDIVPTQNVEEYDITKTAGFREAMDDVKHGRVTKYSSAGEMFNDLGIAL